MSQNTTLPPDPTTGSTEKPPFQAAVLRSGPGGAPPPGRHDQETRRRKARAARQSFIRAWGLHIVLSAMSFTLILPFLWMLLTSLKTLDQVGVGGWLPQPKSLITVADLAEPELVFALVNDSPAFREAGLILTEQARGDAARLVFELNGFIAAEEEGRFRHLLNRFAPGFAEAIGGPARDWNDHATELEEQAVANARIAADRALGFTRSRLEASRQALAEARAELDRLEASDDATAARVDEARRAVTMAGQAVSADEDMAASAEEIAARDDADLPLDPDDIADITVALRIANRYVFNAALSIAAERAGLSEGSPLAGPQTIQWGNYLEVFSAIPFARYYWNSIFVAAWVTFLQCFTSSLAAFSFARLQWPGRDKVFVLYLSTMMLPGLVMMIPNYQIMITLGLVDTLTGLILPAAFTAFGTFLLRQFMLTIPASLDEAAEIDGASKLQVYWDVILPLARPGLVTLAIFTFMGNYNSFFWPLVMQKSQHNYTLPIGLLYFQSSAGEETNLLMAAVTMSIVPMVIVFIVMQKQLVAGIQLGAVKG